MISTQLSQAPEKSISSHISSFSPMVNRQQLKQIILEKYDKLFRDNPKKMQLINQAIEKAFDNNPKITEKTLKDIKNDLKNSVQGSFFSTVFLQKIINTWDYRVSKSYKYEKQRRKSMVQSSLQLPPIDQRNNSSIQGGAETETNLYTQKKPSFFRKQQSLQKLSKIDFSQQVDTERINNPTEETQKAQNEIEIPFQNVIEQIQKKNEEQIVQKTDQNLQEIQEKSVYEDQQEGDEYAKLVKLQYLKFLQENKNKKEKKKLQQQQLKEDLDQFILSKKIVKKQIKLTDQNEGLEEINREIEKFDQRVENRKKYVQEEEKKQNQIRKEQEEKKYVTKNIEREIEKKQQQNQDFYDLEKEKLIDQQEKQKKIKELEFYQKAKKDYEIFRPQNKDVLKLRPQIQGYDNYDYLSVFEKNKREREQKVLEKLEKFEKQSQNQEILSRNSSMPSSLLKQMTLETVNEDFQNYQKELSQKKKEKIQKNIELEEYHKKQIELKKQKKIEAKKQDDFFALQIQKSITEIDQKEAQKFQAKKDMNESTQRYIKEQIQQNALKNSPSLVKKMTNEELLLNKQDLKSCSESLNLENNLICKSKTTQFKKHIKKMKAVNY